MKNKRIKDRKMLNRYHTMSCWACGKVGCDPAHIKSRGARGDDIPENVMALCRDHHNEQGRVGIITFLFKYDMIWQRLVTMGWEMLPGYKLHHPKLCGHNPDQ